MQGPLTCWRISQDEGDFQHMLYFEPLDAFSICISRVWIFDQPLVFDSVESTAEAGRSAWQNSKLPLFAPMFLGSMAGTLVSELRGPRTTFADIVHRFHTAGCPEPRPFDVVGPHQHPRLDILCYKAPAPMLELLVRGYWAEILLVGRWLRAVPFAQVPALEQNKVMGRASPLVFAARWSPRCRFRFPAWGVGRAAFAAASICTLAV